MTTTSYTNEGGGLAATTFNAEKHKTRRVSDVFGRLMSVTGYTGRGTTADPCAADGTTWYTNHPLDLLTGVNDAAGNATSMRYDSLGRKTWMDDPDMGDWSYTYDVAGNVLSLTDEKLGQTQEFRYDERDRLTHAWTTGSASYSYDETYTYNRIGNLTKAGVNYIYPAAGSPRPHAVSSVGGQAYTYDLNGNLVSGGGRSYTWVAAFHALAHCDALHCRWKGRRLYNVVCV